jgi:hypothetical protein
MNNQIKNNKKKRISKQNKSSNYKKKTRYVNRQNGGEPLHLRAWDYLNNYVDLQVNSNIRTFELKHIIADKMGLRLFNLEDMALFTIRGAKLTNGIPIIRQGIRDGDQIKMIMQTHEPNIPE